MSPTPPLSSAPRPTADPSSSHTDDGVTLNVVEARGAQRTGAVWILAISLALAIVALGAYWLIQSPRMAAVNHPSGQDLNVKDVRKLYTPPATPPIGAPTSNATGGA
jgi:hypothetical protein